MTLLAEGWLAPVKGDAKAFVAFAAHAFGVGVDELTGPSRCWPIVGYRKVAMAAARELGWPFTLIASEFGRFDHTTAISAVRTVGADDELSGTARTLADAYRNSPKGLF